MQTLIEHMKKKDHWDCLDELFQALGESSRAIHGIAQGMDEKIIEDRAELPEHLVRAFLMIEVAKVKLSVLPSEWNEMVDKVVAELTKTEVSFDEVEF